MAAEEPGREARVLCLRCFEMAHQGDCLVVGGEVTAIRRRVFIDACDGKTACPVCQAIERGIAAALARGRAEPPTRAGDAEALRQSLDIITRACEHGAYVGRTSPAVTQARELLDALARAREATP